MVRGTCDDRFSRVREEFARNLGERGEVGASVAVTLHGEPVVDLWGGLADQATGRPWERDTVTLVQSCTKGATALCAHLLAAAGELDLDAPVRRYWPEFARAGKEEVRVSHLLSHQAGLPALREPLSEGAFSDWEQLVDRLAAEEPFWQPGTRPGFHAFTFGYLVGEVVRRVAGTSPGTFFAEQVAGPLGLDFWIGLPPEEEPRVAPLIELPWPAADAPQDRWHRQATEEPGSLPSLVLFNTGGYTRRGVNDSPEAHRAELPSGGGISNARGLALMYAALCRPGRIGDTTLTRADLVRMGACAAASGHDAVLQTQARWTLGFHKTLLSAPDVVPAHGCVFSEAAFGHTGGGGSVGFADPEAGLAFGYVTSRQQWTLGVTDAQHLIDAVYTALGYTSRRYGCWT